MGGELENGKLPEGSLILYCPDAVMDKRSTAPRDIKLLLVLAAEYAVSRRPEEVHIVNFVYTRMKVAYTALTPEGLKFLSAVATKVSPARPRLPLPRLRSLPPPWFAQWSADTLRAYRTKSGKKKSVQEVQGVVEMLNQAGVGRYSVGGQLGERVPKAGSKLGQAGVKVREAIAELTYTPGDRALRKNLNSALRAWRAALTQAADEEQDDEEQER